MATNHLLIPQDIIDIIVDSLEAGGEWTALRACSLVSPSFLHPCRKHIFGKISLMATGRAHIWSPGHPEGPGVQILSKRFLRLLRQSPHIVQYVRTLIMKSVVGGDTDWMKTSEEIPSIIGLLVKLEKFEFRSKVPMHWSNFAPTVRSSLISLIRSHRLQKLALQGVMGLPMSLAEHFGSLNILHVLDVTLEHGESTQIFNPMVLNSTSEMRALSARGPDSIMEWLFFPKAIAAFVDYARFFFLDIQLGANTLIFQFLSEFLEKAISLRNIHFLLLDDVDRLLLPAFLAHRRLPHIHHISFFLNLATLPYIYNFAKNFPENNSVKVMGVMCPLNYKRREGLQAMEKWNAIDFDIPFKQLEFHFFLAESEPGDKYEPPPTSASDDFSEQLREILRPSFMALIIQDKVKIFLQETRYCFGHRLGAVFHLEEALRLRDSIIGLT